MKRYETGTKAPYGIYLSLRPLDVRFNGADDESLEGLPEISYRHLPTWMVIILGPALGGAFVVAFPLLLILVILGTVASLTFKRLTGRQAYAAPTQGAPAVEPAAADGASGSARAETSAQEADGPVTDGER